MICIDNSEWMRNGDYVPNRFQSQADAVHLICGAKTQSNPESTVGVLTMAGKGVRVLVTPTTDLGKIFSCMHGVEVGGSADITAAVQVAQLALKHRQNKNQRQRVIVFAGSPITADKALLEVVGKKLKKNSVSLDIVSFGEEDDGKAEKLGAFLAAVNSNDSSHLLHVPAGSTVLSDALLSSPIFTGDGEGGSGFAASAAAGAAAAAAAAGGASGFEFGVDPNLDPELALALRVSMEEERARQEANAKRAAEAASASDSQNAQTRSAADVSMSEAAGVDSSAGVGQDFMDDENTLLKQALAMSMSDGAGHTGGDATMAETSGEDQDLAFALQISMQEAAASASGGTSEMNKVLHDQHFVSSILSSLPGVDPNDPSVRDVLASLQSENEQKPEEKKDKETDSSQ
ncbi:hypothetical protein KP509_22G050400 [Ceratopteris richardii]|nr:hypothetical protein KP509_22G050400 [Ceratopteris richardii]